MWKEEEEGEERVTLKREKSPPPHSTSDSLGIKLTDINSYIKGVTLQS